MFEAGHPLCFGDETIAYRWIAAELMWELFDGHGAFQIAMPSFVDHTPATAPDFGSNVITRKDLLQQFLIRGCHESIETVSINAEYLPRPSVKISR